MTLRPNCPIVRILVTDKQGTTYWP